VCGKDPRDKAGAGDLALVGEVAAVEAERRGAPQVAPPGGEGLRAGGVLDEEEGDDLAENGVGESADAIDAAAAAAASSLAGAERRRRSRGGRREAWPGGAGPGRGGRREQGRGGREAPRRREGGPGREGGVGEGCGAAAPRRAGPGREARAWEEGGSASPAVGGGAAR